MNWSSQSQISKLEPKWSKNSAHIDILWKNNTQIWYYNSSKANFEIKHVLVFSGITPVIKWLPSSPSRRLIPNLNKSKQTYHDQAVSNLTKPNKTVYWRAAITRKVLRFIIEWNSEKIFSRRMCPPQKNLPFWKRE